MRRGPFPIPHAGLTMLPHPPRNANAPNPSNADIMKAIDDVKANQQALQNDINKIKKHILLLDQLCLITFLILGHSLWIFD